MVASRQTAPRRVGRAAGRVKKLYRRWRHVHEPLSESLWLKSMRSSSYAQALPRKDQQRLRRLTARFLRTKSFEGANGFSINKSMRVRIALHASLPVLNLGLEYYDDWISIVIYPGDFRVQDEHMDEYGVVHPEIMDLCGQSLSQGPIVLSWEAIREEAVAPADHDLVIHECAHKLDMLNGAANGFPPLHSGMDARAWARDFHDAYRRLCTALDSRDRYRLDPYAAEDPAEFFAVLSETFFTAPHYVREDFSAVYDHLQRFYRQDPDSVIHRTKS
ncbi:MAG: zinc-dependent peptidase [Sulfuricaulis sp.]|nr:zinc-dependent peptidase [Sulfuricaulis sp.]